MAAFIALEATDAIVGQHKATIAENVTLANDFFSRHQSLFAWQPPCAGSIAFPRLLTGVLAPELRWCVAELAKSRNCIQMTSTSLQPDPSSTVAAGEPIDKYCARLLKASGVLLLPATLYEHEASTDGGHFRLGLGKRNFAECLGRWQTFIEADH